MSKTGAELALCRQGIKTYRVPLHTKEIVANLVADGPLAEADIERDRGGDCEGLHAAPALHPRERPGALWFELQKKTAHAAEQDRPDIVRRRLAWFEGQLDLDPDKLVFIDETGASTKMARLYGRAPRGRRLLPAPYGHWKTTTFVAALRPPASARRWCSTGR